MKILYGVLLVTLMGAPAAFAAPVDGTPGKTCFLKMEALQDAYDPKAVDMIDDKAVITITALFPDGTTKSNVVNTAEYKKKALQDLVEGKEKNVIHSYAGLQAKPEKGAFRVTGSDRSSADNVVADFSTLYKVDKKQQCSVSEMTLVIHAPSNPPKAD